MTPLAFFATSGVVAWCWLVWRAIHIMRQFPNRLRWALWPYKRAKVLRRYG